MKRILALCCALVLALGMLGCATAEEAAAPKYVFMFIGDGMGNPQVSATQYFLGTLQNPDADPAHPRGAELHHLSKCGHHDHLRRVLLLPGQRLHRHQHGQR